MASLHLVDQATIEMFVSILLDENENCGQNDEKVFENDPELRGEDEMNDDKNENMP